MTTHESDPKPGETHELLMLRRGFDRLHALVPPDGEHVVVRTGRSKVRPVEGEFFSVEVEKSWIFGSTQYVKGKITAAHFDLERLELEPLGLEDWGSEDYDPESLDYLPEEIARQLLKEETARVFEMEVVMPELEEEPAPFSDPTFDAAELIRAGDVEGAADLLGRLLTMDLRCIDAHSHLGLIEFEAGRYGDLDMATRNYRIGVSIGDQALGPDFFGRLPWGVLGNRPYLRCLHGLGLCCWRAGDFEGALNTFRRLLLFNPADNQGVRFLWDDVVAGRPWPAQEMA